MSASASICQRILGVFKMTGESSVGARSAMITGATGLLGREVVKAFKEQDWHCIQCGFSRASGDVLKLDLTDETALRKFVAEHCPKVIVHCAAERKPDAAQNNREYILNLNSKSASLLSEAAKDVGALLIFISTDYVFDGKNPPYKPLDPTNPLNFYGESKQMAEKAVHAANPDAIIMRIPILYGPTKDFKESAVSELILGVEKGSPVEMDNICVRYPTCTIDIARVLADVAKLYISKGWPGIRGEDTQLPTTLHFSAQEAFTKYKMSLIFAELLGIKNDHLKPVNESDESAKDSTVQRPKDCHLDISDLKNLGINCGTVNFKEWFRSVLCPRLR